MISIVVHVFFKELDFKELDLFDLMAVPIKWAFPFNGRSEGDYPRRLFEGDYSKEWRTRYFWSGAHDIFWSGI